MAVESEEFTELGDEFALVAQTAAEVGAAGSQLPRVRRGWVNVPAGGHVSGVFWGDGPAEVVFLHDIGESARAWDAVALTVGRPSLAIDLPGHGRSDWRRDGRYEPGKLEIAYDLCQDQDGSWAWRHHPGSLPAAPLGGDAGAGDPGVADEALWRELGQLGAAAVLIRGDWAGPLSAADLAGFGERAPGAQVITIPGGGADVVATQPAALAAALDQLLTTAPEGQR
jgi:pimeloyl-ACP methyl ester carboxylesterase